MTADNLKCPKCGKRTADIIGNTVVCSNLKCPKCGKRTATLIGSTVVCSNPNCKHKGGKLKTCPACKKLSWFDGRCFLCGAHELPSLIEE